MTIDSILYHSSYRSWLLLSFFLLLPGFAFSQLPDVKVDIDAENKSAVRVLEEISLQTGYYFTYNSSLLPRNKKISLKANDIALEQALDRIFGTGLSYKLVDKNIVVYPHKEKNSSERADSAYEQALRITGIVKDKQTNKALPFATVLIDGTNRGIVSNLQGKFSLVIPPEIEEPILIVSNIGYKNYYLHVNPEKSDEVEVQMEKDIISLQEVMIRYQNPVEIIRRMKDSISANYLDIPSTMSGYFREYVLKNKEYVTFSEAIINISKSPYTLSLKNDKSRLVRGRKIQNISREDSILLKIKSGVNTSLQLDIINHRPDFLLMDYEPYYHYEFRNIVSYRNRQVYLIAFSPKEGYEYALYSGELYINKNDFALVAAEFYVASSDLKKNPGRFLVRKSPDIRVKPQKARYRVEYRKKDEKYHLSMVQAEVGFRLRKKREWFGSLFSIGIEMAITDIQPGIYEKIPRRERLHPGTILSDQEFSYDPDFWGNYDIIQPEASLQEALERMGYEWEEF
jgi:hypothetical protein